MAFVHQYVVSPGFHYFPVVPIVPLQMQMVPVVPLRMQWTQISAGFDEQFEEDFKTYVSASLLPSIPHSLRSLWKKHDTLVSKTLTGSDAAQFLNDLTHLIHHI